MQPRPFWQRRFYDFNVFSDEKRLEKRRYMHRNPVLRGLAVQPGDWAWSSDRHWATGAEGAAHVTSSWTFVPSMASENNAARLDILPTHISKSRCGAPTLEVDQEERT